MHLFCLSPQTQLFSFLQFSCVFALAVQAWLLEQLFPYITKCGDGIVQTAGSKHKLIGCEQN